MARSQPRQREKLLARAAAIGSSISNEVVEPLSRQIDELQAELQALSAAAASLARQRADGPGPDTPRAGAAPPRTGTREAPVVFLHIPKTAGTTVAIWLRLLHGDAYSKAASYTTEPDKVRSLAAALEQRPGSVEVVAGHLPYSARSLFPAQSPFFTFLRDPIDRAVSHFCYFSEREHGAGMSLADALAAWDAASPESQALLPDNLQTRMLSGFDLDAPASRDMLDAAKRHLRECDVVGLTERFHESVSLLHHVYGWKLLAIPSRRVRTHQRPSVGALEPGVVAGLRRLNALDEELYEEGVRHLEAAMARYGDALARDVEALRRARHDGAPGAVAANNGASPAEQDAIDRRAAEILADTAAALDEDLPEQAHGIAMTLASHTRQIGDAVASHVQQIAQLTREITELVKKQHARV
jgi:hypothetical protein